MSRHDSSAGADQFPGGVRMIWTEHLAWRATNSASGLPARARSLRPSPAAPRAPRAARHAGPAPRCFANEPARQTRGQSLPRTLNRRFPSGPSWHASTNYFKRTTVSDAGLAVPVVAALAKSAKSNAARQDAAEDLPSALLLHRKPPPHSGVKARRGPWVGGGRCDSLMRRCALARDCAARV